MYRNLTKFEDRPSNEINIGSIRALEEQIRGCERAMTNFKRAQTSSLNAPTPSPQSM